MSRIVDLIGKRFGRLTVIALHPERSPWREAIWLCRCDDGPEILVAGSLLRKGHTSSCGCFQRESLAKRNTKHGMSRTKIYRIWCAMMQRCFNPNDPAYVYYGGRGITVCERWRTFENFYADVGDPPDGLTLDRIDNDGSYEPDNWRWTTQSVQVTNRRRFLKTKTAKHPRAKLADICAYAAALKRAGAP